MDGLFGLGLLALRRIRREPMRFLALAFGFLVAGVLLSGTAIYSETMRATALTYALDQIPPEDIHLEVRSSAQRFSQDEFGRLDRLVRTLTQRRLGTATGPVVTRVRGATFYLGFGDRPLPPLDVRPRTFLFSQTELPDHLEIVAGGFPGEVAYSPGDAESELVLPALAGAESAEAMGVELGDRLSLYPFWDDRVERVTVEVVGIARPRNPGSPYWADRTSPLEYPATTYRTLPLFVPRETLFRGAGGVLERLSYNMRWLAPVRRDRLTAGNAGPTADSLRRLRADLLRVPTEPILDTELTGALETFATRLFFTGVPLTLLVTQVEGITLLYLLILGFFLAERQRAELALLRSRGASTWQLLLPSLGEALLIAGLTVAVAPFLTALLVALVGLTPWLEPLTGGGLLPVALTGRAFLLAILGAALGLAAVLVPAYLTSRSTGVQLRQQAFRVTGRPFFLRYHLDILVLVSIVLIGWQVFQQGSLVRFNLAGQAVVNPALYALPSLVVLSAAMLFLRLFPVLANLAARALDRRAPLVLLLGVWYLARGPRAAGALVLLLALASGTTLFAASFGPTLERNTRERVLYNTGAPLRVEHIRMDQSGRSFSPEERLGDLQPVTTVSPAYRADGTDLAGFEGQSYTMLAVDAASFAEVGWYRKDFSAQSLNDLLEPLQEDKASGKGIDIPIEAERLGVWVRPGKAEDGLSLAARVRDANGQVVDYELGQLDVTDWTYMETTLDSVQARSTGPVFHPGPPLTLLAFLVTERRGRDAGPGIVYLDDVQSTGSALPGPVILEDFEEPQGWHAIVDHLDREPDSFDYAGTPVHSGESAAAFSWISASLFTVQGITMIPQDRPLAAIASASFLSQSGRSVGDRAVVSVADQSVAVTITGQAEFFPTLDPYQNAFLLVGLDRLGELHSIQSPTPDTIPNEFWLDSATPAGAAVEQVLQDSSVRYRTLLDRSTRMEAARIDPFVLGGWMGWILIALVATSVISVAGFVTYAVLELERRMASMAALESLGMTSRQLLGVVSFELLVLLVAGGLLGVVMGAWLGSLLLPFLDVTGTGRAAVPPLVVVRTWSGVSLVYLGIGAVLGTLLAFILRWFSRLSLQQVLKLEEG